MVHFGLDAAEEHADDLAALVDRDHGGARPAVGQHISLVQLILNGRKVERVWEVGVIVVA